MKGDIKAVLSGHDSPETAYTVDDYPYGYTLRCKIRYWVETTKSGQRMCSQTTNPKVAAEVWNKPKKGTYAPLVCLYLDHDDHVRCAKYDSAYYYGKEKFDEFVETFKDALGGEYEVKFVETLRMIWERTKQRELANIEDSDNT